MPLPVDLLLRKSTPESTLSHFNAMSLAVLFRYPGTMQVYNLNGGNKAACQEKVSENFLGCQRSFFSKARPKYGGTEYKWP